MSAQNQIIQLDNSAWRETISRISGALGKSFPDVLNRSVASILFKAARLTPTANRAEIRNEFYGVRLEAVGVYKSGKRKGQTKFRVKKFIPPKAYAIYRVAKDDRTSKGEELYRRVRKFVARRIASAGYLRKSWYVAVRPFIKYTKLAQRGDISRYSSRPVAIGRPATQSAGWAAVAEVENRAVVNNASAMDTMKAALEQAIMLETRQLQIQLEKILARDIARAATR